MERIDRHVWLTIPGESDIFYRQIFLIFSNRVEAAYPNIINYISYDTNKGNIN